jgi:hypothetical protein
LLPVEHFRRVYKLVSDPSRIDPEDKPVAEQPGFPSLGFGFQHIPFNPRGLHAGSPKQQYGPAFDHEKVLAEFGEPVTAQPSAAA